MIFLAFLRWRCTSLFFSQFVDIASQTKYDLHGYNYLISYKSVWTNWLKKKNSTAGIDKEKKNPKSLDYDLSNTKYNEQVFWNLFNASYRFCFLLVDCTPISQWFQTWTLNIWVSIFLAHLLQMASNSAFIRVHMIIRLPVKLVTLKGAKGRLLFLFWKSLIQRVETTLLKGYFRGVTERIETEIIFTPFFERKFGKKNVKQFSESGTSGCKSKTEIVRVVANTIFPLYKIANRMLFLKRDVLTKWVIFP